MMKKMPNKVKNIINKFILGTNEILGPRVKKIILYGSYSRIDIMILTDLTDDEMLKYRNDIYNFAYDIECENNFNISISPIIKNIDKFNYWLEALPFYINVNKEGVVLSES